MCRKFFAAAVIITAVVLAIAWNLAKADSVDYIVAIARFFDIILPILAVGALIKYLCFNDMKSCCCPCHGKSKCSLEKNTLQDS